MLIPIPYQETDGSTCSDSVKNALTEFLHDRIPAVKL